MIDRWALSHTMLLLARSDDVEVVAVLLVAVWLLLRDVDVRKMLRRKTKKPLDHSKHVQMMAAMQVRARPPRRRCRARAERMSERRPPPSPPPCGAPGDHGAHRSMDPLGGDRVRLPVLSGGALR